MELHSLDLLSGGYLGLYKAQVIAVQASFNRSLTTGRVQTLQGIPEVLL